jgi:hypothetical protein
MEFACWLSGQSGGLVVQSFLTLSNFSACPGAALNLDTNQVSKSQRARRSWCKESWSCSGRKFNMGWWVHSCGLWFEELSGGVGTGGILVIECIFWNVGGLLQVCGLWFVEEFQNLVPEVVCLGSWFRNSIIKKKIFEFLNPFGLVPAKVVPRNEIWGEVILKTLAVPARKCTQKILLPKWFSLTQEMLPTSLFLNLIFLFSAHGGSLPIHATMCYTNRIDCQGHGGVFLTSMSTSLLQKFLSLCTFH